MMSTPRRAPRAYAVRVGAFYAALFLILGIHLPYLPLWLDWRGLSALEIAIITSTPLFLRLLITPAIAFFADRSDSHRDYILRLSLAGTVIAFVLAVVGGFWAIFAVAVAFAICVSTLMPLIDTVAVAGVKREGIDYGRVRLWGSLAFIGVGFLGGALVDQLDAGIIIWMLVLAAMATAVAANALPRPAANASHHDVAGMRRLIGDDAKRLTLSGTFLLFLIASSAIQGAHGTFYTFGALHWRSQGISTAWIGALWAIGVLSEVVLFAYAAPLVQRSGAAVFLIAGGGAACLRWAVMGLDPDLEILVPLQVLHALTYGATHLGAIHFIARAVPETAAGTAQALYGTFAAGVVTGAATLASGPLYNAYAGKTYFFMVGLAAIGTAAAIYLKLDWKGGPLWRRDGVDGKPAIGGLGPKLPVGPEL